MKKVKLVILSVFVFMTIASILNAQEKVVDQAEIKDTKKLSLEQKTNARIKLGQIGIKYDMVNFLMCCERGDLVAVNLFLEAGWRIDSIIDLICAKADNPDIVRMLLDKGADVNIKDIGRTPLMQAVMSGGTEVIKVLLEKKADINIKNSEGQTALDIANSGKNPLVIQLLQNAVRN